MCKNLWVATAVTLALTAGPASAQGIFDSFKKGVEQFKKDGAEAVDIVKDVTGLGEAAQEAAPPAGQSEVVYNSVPDRVAQVQGLLNQLGFPAGPVDGAFGSGTKSAIVQFQTSRGLVPTGDVTASLIFALEQAVVVAGGQPQNQPLQLEPQFGQNGSPALDIPNHTPQWVSEIQTHLTSLGHPVGSIDGQLGPNTVNAIAAFQLQAGLQQDGEPRPSTMQALRNQLQTLQAGGILPQSGPTGQVGVQAAPSIDLPAYQTAPPVTGSTEYEHLLLRFVQANPNLIENEEFINGFANRGCTPELQEAKKNEITRFQYLQQAKSRIPQYAVQAAALPPGPVTIRLESLISIAQYDFERQGFPIQGVNDSEIRHDENCDVFAPRTAYPRSFAFSDLEGAPFDNARFATALALLPMSQAEAQVFLSDGSRSVKLQVSYGVGKQAPNPDSTSKQNFKRRIRSVITKILAVDAKSGEVLHSFDPVLLAPEAPSAPLSATVSEATYDRFFEAHLALHPEVAEDQDFGLQYVSYLPSAQACPAEFDLLKGNEFARQQFFSQHWPAMQAQFRQVVSTARPPSENEVLRVRTERTAGTYDFASQTFELRSVGAGNTVHVGEAFTGFPQQKTRRFCASLANTMPTGYIVNFRNQDTITKLPLQSAQANALDANNPEREIDLVLDFVLEDAVSGAGPRGEATARIVNAAAYDAVSKQLLHQYNPALFAPPAADPWDRFPAPNYRSLLLALVSQSPNRAQDDSYVERFISTEACEALQNVDEFAKRNLIASYRPRMVAAAAAESFEPGQIFKLSFEQPIGAYDFEQSKFPFADSQGNARILIQPEVRCYTQGSAPSVFYASVERPFSLLQTGLPMSASEAQNLSGKVKMDVLVTLETPSGADGNLGTVTTRLLEARLRSVGSNEDLYHYGPEVLGGPGAQAADPFAGVEPPTHELLLQAYLATRPNLTGDRSFVNRYTASSRCEQYRSANEFDRRALADTVQAQLVSTLGAGAEAIETVRISLELKLGEYDFDAGRFPLSVPKTSGNVSVGSIKLDDAITTLQVEAGGGVCRDKDFSPAFPDIFLLTIDGTETIDAIGVPMDSAAAQSHINREVPAYTDAKEIRLDMLVRVDEMRDTIRTHPQKSDHISLVTSRIVAAQVVDPVSSRILHGFDLNAEIAALPTHDALTTLPPGILPEGAEYVEVSQADTTAVRSHVMIDGSGLGTPSDGQLNGRYVQPGNEADILAYVRNRPNSSVLMSAEQFARAYDSLRGINLRVAAFESPETAARRRLNLAESGLPYGPAVAGLQLGMDFAEAEASIRAQMDVGWVLQLPRDPRAGVQGMKPYNAGRLFVARDGSEIIGIFNEPPAAAGTVLGVWRQVEVADPNVLASDVLALLTEEYGPTAVTRNETSWQWGETAGDSSCRPSARVSVGENLVEGPPLDTVEARKIRTSLQISSFIVGVADVGTPPNLEAHQDCGPIISASFRISQNPLDRVNQLQTALIDHGHYGRRYMESFEALRSGVAGGGLAQTASRLLGGGARTDVQNGNVAETTVASAATSGVATDAVLAPAPATEVQVQPVTPVAPDIAALSKFPVTPEAGDVRAAADFQILNVTVGMTEAQAMSTLAGEFLPDQIDVDTERGAIFAQRGVCNYAEPTDPAIAAEAGSFCLALQLTEGTVSRIALRQVIPGDVTAPAISALQERYGSPNLRDVSIVGSETSQVLVGWGQPVGAERDVLGRVASTMTAAVLEGNIWHGSGVSTIVLRLDNEAPPPAAAPAAKIKF